MHVQGINFMKFKVFKITVGSFVASLIAGTCLIGTEHPAHAAVCKVARVTIEEVQVTKSDDVGASAEWQLTFSVAGQQVAKRFDGVRPGSVLPVDEQFLVDLDNVDDQLPVSVFGEEIDTSSADDDIPRATYRIIPKDNWVDGGRYQASASNNDFAYNFTFKVQCAN